MTENLRTTASEYFGNKYSPKYFFKLKKKQKQKKKQQCNNIHECCLNAFVIDSEKIFIHWKENVRQEKDNCNVGLQKRKHRIF